MNLYNDSELEVKEISERHGLAVEFPLHPYHAPRWLGRVYSRKTFDPLIRRAPASGTTDSREKPPAANPTLNEVAEWKAIVEGVEELIEGPYRDDKAEKVVQKAQKMARYNYDLRQVEIWLGLRPEVRIGCGLSKLRHVLANLISI